MEPRRRRREDARRRDSPEGPNGGDVARFNIVEDFDER
jgi:hypothetical protein